MRPHLLLSLPLLLACACAATPEVRPEGPRVVDFTIQGAEDVSAGELKEHILTTEAPWYRRLFPWLPLGEDPRFDANAWQADLRRIERYYQARGYYQAEVVEEQVLTPTGQPVEEGEALPDAVKLQVRVEEGEPTLVGDVQVRGLEELPEGVRRAVLDDLPLQPRSLFVEEDWESLKELVEQRLRERGYAEAKVEGEALVDVATHRAQLNLETRPGQLYRFGKVFVATDVRPVVSPARIIEQTRGAVEEGQPYSESALAEAQARVFRMGVFGAVKVNRGLVNREAGTVPVVVDVREAPFHSVRAGVGVGVDAYRSEARLSGQYTDRNFFGGLRLFTVEGRVGYAVLPSVIDSLLGSAQPSKGDFVFDVSTRLEQPRILFRDVSAQVQLFAERGLEPAYDYWGGGGQLGVIWRPTAALSLSTSFHSEFYSLQGDVGVVDPTQQTSSNLTLGCPRREASCGVLLNYLEQTLEYDRRDDRIEPRRGYYLALSLQEGGGLLQGNYNFVRIQPEVRGYHSFGDNDVLTVAGRVRTGTLLSFSTKEDEAAGAAPVSPIVSRFFSGGGNSMRGFNSRRLSPLVTVRPLGEDGRPLPPPVGPVPYPTEEETKQAPLTQTVPVGGSGLFESTLEARYSLTRSLVLATFLDMGLVTAEEFGRITDACPPGGGRPECQEAPVDVLSYLGRNMLYALGLGVRYRTPVGPIRVDVAYRLPLGPALGTDTSGAPGGYFFYDDSCFGLGGSYGEKNRPVAAGERLPARAGSPEGRCVFTLSIGEAF